jgi:hypothetical protein
MRGRKSPLSHFTTFQTRITFYGILQLRKRGCPDIMLSIFFGHWTCSFGPSPVTQKSFSHKFTQWFSLNQARLASNANYCLFNKFISPREGLWVQNFKKFYNHVGYKEYFEPGFGKIGGGQVDSVPIDLMAKK